MRKLALFYGAVVLSFLLVIVAMWYDRNQLSTEIEKLKNQPIPAPEVIIKEVPTLTIAERIVYRDSPPVIKEVIQIQEVEKVIEAPVKLRDFPDIQTARSWLESHKPPIVLIADVTGYVNLVNPSVGSYDCEDYALELQQMAAKDGWNVWPVAVTDGTVWNIRVLSSSNTNPYHLGNMMRIQGTFYYVESSPPNQGYIVPLLNED